MNISKVGGSGQSNWDSDQTDSRASSPNDSNTQSTPYGPSSQSSSFYSEMEGPSNGYGNYSTGDRVANYSESTGGGFGPVPTGRPDQLGSASNQSSAASQDSFSGRQNLSTSSASERVGASADSRVQDRFTETADDPISSDLGPSNIDQPTADQPQTTNPSPNASGNAVVPDEISTAGNADEVATPSSPAADYIDSVDTETLIDTRAALNHMKDARTWTDDGSQRPVSYEDDLPAIASGEAFEDNPVADLYSDEKKQTMQDSASFILDSEEASEMWKQGSQGTDPEGSANGEMSPDEFEATIDNIDAGLDRKGIEHHAGNVPFSIGGPYPTENDPSNDIAVRTLSEPELTTQDPSSGGNSIESWKVTATYEDDSQIDIYVANEVPFDEWSGTPEEVAERYATDFGKLPPGIRDTIMSGVNEHHLGLAHTAARDLIEGVDNPAVKGTLATVNPTEPGSDEFVLDISPRLIGMSSLEDTDSMNPDVLQSTLIHEAGHMIHNAVGREDVNNDLIAAVNADAASVSRYAEDNTNETFGEGYHLWYMLRSGEITGDQAEVLEQTYANQLAFYDSLPEAQNSLTGGRAT